MKVSIESKMILGFVMSFLALASIGWLSYHNTANLIATENWVSHTHEVIGTLESGLAILTDAETSQRGYLLTGNEDFLKDSQTAQAQISGWLEKIRNLTQDNPQQQQRLAALELLIKQRLTLLNSRIKLRQEHGMQAAGAAVGLREGKGLMDQVWKGISEMRAAENQLLAQRQQAAQSSAKTTMIIIVIGGTFACAVGLMAVVTVRRDLRLRTTAQEERMRFFNLSRDLLCISSFEGHFKEVNPAFERTLDFTSEEMLARPFLDFVHPDDVAATLAEVEKQSKGGEVLYFENRYLCKDGSYRWLAWSSRVDATRQLMYGTARDITNQKHSEVQIAKLNADLKFRATQLEVANNELEAFSYSVSHDLRAPLRHVMGFVQLLQKDVGSSLSEKNLRHLTTISEAAKRMGNLIDDLLAFSRIGRAEMQKTQINLDELVRETLGDFETEIKGRNIVLEIHPLSIVRADRALLRMVLVNLISNAVKFTGRRVEAKIEIGSMPNGDSETAIFIRDNGVGFDPQYAGKLFGVFQRLHSIIEFEGTGIGLANVQRIIHRHGGRVWAEGVVDGGATFYFSIPKQMET
jgi:PAS domain S-box-containing protein